MLCQFKPAANGRFRCSECGVERNTDHRRVCGPDNSPNMGKPASDPGLGDRFAWLLAVFGIDKKRYRKFKHWLGLQDSCGCDKRQAAMNNWEKWAKTALQKALYWLP